MIDDYREADALLAIRWLNYSWHHVDRVYCNFCRKQPMISRDWLPGRVDGYADDIGAPRLHTDDAAALKLAEAICKQRPGTALDISFQPVERALSAAGWHCRIVMDWGKVIHERVAYGHGATLALAICAAAEALPEA